MARPLSPCDSGPATTVTTTTMRDELSSPHDFPDKSVSFTGKSWGAGPLQRRISRPGPWHGPIADDFFGAQACYTRKSGEQAPQPQPALERLGWRPLFCGNLGAKDPRSDTFCTSKPVDQAPQPHPPPHRETGGYPSGGTGWGPSPNAYDTAAS